MSKEVEYKVKEEVWKTETGDKINVGDMSEEHAKNALRLCIKNIRTRRFVASANIATELNIFIEENLKEKV